MAATLQPSVVQKDFASLQDSNTNRILEQITRSALHATGASGAALVLSDGKIMSCRACSGDLVPPVGTRLNADTGFTATCVQTAQVVRCDNTETDPRVDGANCIELGIRSILAVPVFDAQNVTGVLLVLSREPKKFADRHATALQLLARLIETLLNYVPCEDSSLNPLSRDAKLQGTESSKADAVEARTACLTCGHPNPQGSQFCNRCGVILLISPTPQDATVDLSLPDVAVSGADEGLKEIYKLISESGALATWNDIYTRLMANLQSTSAAEKPRPAAAAETVKKKDDMMMGFAKARGTPELKTRIGAVHRNLWL
jgi:GAF domain